MTARVQAAADAAVARQFGPAFAVRWLSEQEFRDLMHPREGGR